MARGSRVTAVTVHYVYEEGGGLAVLRDGLVREGRRAAKTASEATAPTALPTRTVHPLVRTHTDSGEEALYVSSANIDYMEAEEEEVRGLPAVRLDTRASYELLEMVLGPSTRAPLVYAHTWRVGDLAIWDNRLTAHAPCHAERVVGERLHHRVRLDGSAAANADLIEHRLRRELAAAHTLSHHFRFDEMVWNHLSARLPSSAPTTSGGPSAFLVTPGDVLFDEVSLPPPPSA